MTNIAKETLVHMAHLGARLVEGKSNPGRQAGLAPHTNLGYELR